MTPDPEWLWEAFVDFCIYELAAGGPDPHMRYVGWLSRDEEWAERAWRMGVYVNVYNTATAEVIWQHWPWAKADAEPEAFAAWIKDNWPGITLRRERRAARTAAKLTHALLGYREFLWFLPSIMRGLTGRSATSAYEEMWRETLTLPTIGRYSAFKLIEALRRYAELPVEMFDIRAPGGFSPRLTLALLMPEGAAAIAAYDDGPEACRASELAAEVIRERLALDVGIECDYYRLEVFLCDFRQSWEGKRQYPGRSNDSELEYLAKASEYWGEHYEPVMLDARAALTPERCRGEDRGWSGVRKELGAVLRGHGYTWSDLRFDYPPDNLAAPEEADGGYDPRDSARQTLAAR